MLGGVFIDAMGTLAVVKVVTSRLHTTGNNNIGLFPGKRWSSGPPGSDSTTGLRIFFTSLGSSDVLKPHVGVEQLVWSGFLKRKSLRSIFPDSTMERISCHPTAPPLAETILSTIWVAVGAWIAGSSVPAEGNGTERNDTMLAARTFRKKGLQVAHEQSSDDIEDGIQVFAREQRRMHSLSKLRSLA